jgi:uncharacterized membrane protein YbaN (DUF454 family)
MSNRLRWVQAAGGVACVALGAVGAVVPLMPTTVFLLCGSYLLVRSAPSLERQLRETRLFRPCLRYLDPSVPMPMKARVAALVSMWTSLAISGGLMHLSGVGGARTLVILVAAGVAGSFAILLFRRCRRWPADAQA